MRPESSAPVVLVGRGGSGTRLMGALADAAGVFLGSELNVSFDSMEWVETIYAQALEVLEGGDRPGAAREARARRLRQTADAVLARAGRGFDSPWGWKLPETIFLLPSVMEAFPAARLVHLTRHPLTSAYRRTHMSARLDNAIGRAALPVAWRAAGWEGEALAEASEARRNAATWRHQVGLALACAAALPADRHLLLRYEEVIAAPDRELTRLVRFLGLEAPSGPPPSADPTRITSFDQDAPEADAIWGLCADVAQRLGYGPDGAVSPVSSGS